MKPALLAVALLSGAAVAQPVPPAPAPLKLERVVMLMRHGIRPPTKGDPLPPGYATDAWPRWGVGWGLLTERGAAGVKLLGQADRAAFAARGLAGAGCPRVALFASNKQRAIRTAESWAAGFMPGCAATVAHPGDTGPDPIFHGLDDEPESFDGAAAYRAALAAAPKGGIAAETRAYRGELALLAKVLGCAPSACPALSEPSLLAAAPHDRPDLRGPLDVGSTASQTFLLEYLEGMPMAQVGWGRVTRSEIERLLRFHPLKFKYANRPDPVARAAGAPLARAVLDGLAGRAAAPVTLLAGHDTNIADLGGFLRIHWQVPSYPADDVPPGSALGFELLRDGAGHRYVRAFYRAQTMDQLREQRPLTGGEVPFRQYLPMPGCGDTAAPTGCSLDRFESLVRHRIAVG